MLTGTPNFSVAEALRASDGYIPPELQDNAQSVLEWLQAARDAIAESAGVAHPIIITSLYRSPEHNATVAGHANDSQHMRALGADFDVLGMTNHEATARILAASAAGLLPGFHQVITYTTDHHVHVGIAGESWPDDRQALLETAVGQYEVLTSERLASLVGDKVVAAEQLAGQAVDVVKANPVVTGLVALAFLAPALLGGRLS